jgi:hypothetical protein
MCTLVALLVLIAISPLSLRFIALKRGINWVQLSNIGQAYGAISAVLSGLALLAVAISIRLQSREHLANRRQVHRDIHMRLTEMAMGDPSIMQCWSPDDLSFERNRQLQYVNLMISFWYMQWEMRDISDKTLSAIASAQLFQSEMGRQYWRMYRNRWRSESLGSRLNRFCKVMDDALQGVSVTLSSGGDVEINKPPKRRVTNVAAIASVAVAGGAIIGGVLRRRGRGG